VNNDCFIFISLKRITGVSLSASTMGFVLRAAGRAQLRESAQQEMSAEA
jgi:hypothetical protein